MASPYPNAFPPDTIENTILGVHMGVPPTLLTRQHVAASVNLTHRGGKPTTRPAIVKRLLNFADDDSDENSTEELFQGASYYGGFGEHRSAIIASIGGKIFRYIPNAMSVDVQDISAGLQNSPVEPQVFMFQGEEFLVINDTKSYPIFYDGSVARRSMGPAGKELPPGAMGTYANGRIVMALPNRQEFIAGDLVHSTASGTPAYNYRDSIIKTHENIAVLAGRAFAVPINSGRINAMFSVAVPDTTLGQGPLQVGTRKGVFGVHLPLDANEWLNLQQPTSVVSLPSAGPLSPWSVPIINTDAWYRAYDGIRSFQVGRRDMGTWVQTPMSSEVGPILNTDTEHLLEFSSAVSFKNRLLMTCSPYLVQGRGVCHRGLIALDFNNISGLTLRSTPDYDGLWTGLPILQIIEGQFNGVDRCFMFALDAENKICLYELLRDGGANHDYDGEENIPIESWLASGALFGLEIHSERIRIPLKKLACADVFLEELAGNVEVDVKYRSDSYPCWVDWKTFALCATECATPTDCSQPVQAQFQYATFRRLPDPADTCNTATGRMHRTGYHFQTRIQWTGHASLDKFLMWCVPTPETVPVCPTTEACKIIQCCGEDYFTYNIEPAAGTNPGNPDEPVDPEEPEECPLEVSVQPVGDTFQIGETIELSVAVTGNTSPPRIVWRRGGITLIDGTDEFGSTVSGATTGTLTILNAQPGHSGIYTAQIFDDLIEGCSATTSNATVLVELQDVEIDDGVTWDGCSFSQAFIESGYGLSFSPGVDPNDMTDAEIAFMLSLFSNERQIWLDVNLPEGASIINLPPPKWYFVGSGGSRYNGVTKISSGITDPEDESGNLTTFFPSGFWILQTLICYDSTP
jgi:hypothetical protein